MPINCHQKYSDLILNSIPLGVVVLNPRQQCCFANLTAQEFFGLSSKQLRRRNFHRLIHPQVSVPHPVSDCPVLKPFSDLAPKRFIRDVFWNSQHVGNWVEYSSIPLIDNNQVQALLLVFADVKAIFQTQQGFIEDQASFRALFDSTPDPILFVTGQGRITRFNPAAAKAFQLSNPPQTTFLKIFSANSDSLRPARSFWRRLKTQKTTHKILYFSPSNQPDLYFRATGIRHVLPHRHLIIFHDDTHRIRQKLQQDRFTTVISHELKTPLSIVKAYNDTIGKQLKSQQLRRYSQKIDQKIDQLNGLISNLVDATKIKSDQLFYSDTIFKLDGLVKKLVNDLSKVADGHQLIVNGQTNSTLKADSDRIYQLIGNLILNAIKYSPSAPKIIVDLGRIDGYASIRITDFGIGIPRQFQRQLFKSFSRSYITLPTSGDRSSGLGLGLYISKHITSHYHGKLSFKSRPGRTTFSLLLPHL